jgi:hypothetical protein
MLRKQITGVLWKRDSATENRSAEKEEAGHQEEMKHEDQRR